MVTTRTVGARQRLLEVAGRLFYAEGIHAVGIDRIITEAGVAKATLYAHFAGKDELVADYLALNSDQWQAWVDTALPARADTPGEQLLALFDLLDERFRTPGYRGCPFINAAAEHPAPGRVGEQIKTHRSRVRRLMRGLLTDAGMDNVEQLTDMVMVLYDGAMVSAQLDAHPTVALDARLAAEQILSNIKRVRSE